jgi:hypothetical protein
VLGISFRRLALLAGAVTFLFVSGVVVVVALDGMTWLGGAAIVLGGPTLAGLVVLGGMVRRTNRRLQAGLPARASFDKRSDDITKRFEAAAAEVTATTKLLTATVREHTIVLLDSFSRASWPEDSSARVTAGSPPTGGGRA